jgi:hypothetical protein
MRSLIVFIFKFFLFYPESNLTLYVHFQRKFTNLSDIIEAVDVLQLNSYLLKYIEGSLSHQKKVSESHCTVVAIMNVFVRTA